MKSFKKLLAIALVAVMALSMFTACGVDTDDLLEQINKKYGTELTKDDSLKSNETYKKVKSIVEDHYLSKDKIDKEIDDVKVYNADAGTLVMYTYKTSTEDAAGALVSTMKAKSGVKFTKVYFEKINHIGGDIIIAIASR